MRALPQIAVLGLALAAAAFPPLQADGGAPAPSEVSIPDVVERSMDSVVNISSTRLRRARRPDPLFRYFFGPGGRDAGPEREEMSLGSGVVYSADGLILTNAHVVEEADGIIVTTRGGRSYDAEVVGTDPASDLAVLRITEKVEKLRPMPLGDSDALRLGESVLALGNPFGLGFTVTQGIVSAKGRAEVGIVEYEDFIQTDAAINPGNSGGPLINTRGELVGINTAILSRTGGFQGVGFAIPVEMARAITDDLIEYGEVRRGWLGVVIQDVTPELADELRLGEGDGVVIADIMEGSPAAGADLRRGDVVVEYVEQPVRSAGELRNAVALTEPGTPVTMTIVRDGQRQRKRVEIRGVPTEGGSRQVRGGGADEGDPFAGATVAPLTPEVRRELRLSREVKQGVVVTAVAPGSPAAGAGLRRGDVIAEANRQPVGSPEALSAQLRQAKKRVLLLVWRDGHTLFLVLDRR
jgi:serine protease Do